MSGFDHSRASPRAAGAHAIALLVLLALPGCKSSAGGAGPAAGAMPTGAAQANGANGAGVVVGAVLSADQLEALAAAAELDVPGELVRAGRYVYSHTDVDGGFVDTMAEDFALGRVAGGHVGKARITPTGYGTTATIAFTLDEDMRLRSLVWRCECDAPQVRLEAAGDRLAVTSIRDGVHVPDEPIALQLDFTLTQFQVLSWAMIGNASLEPGNFKTWHLIDISDSGEVSLHGSTIVTRHADEPLPEPRADRTVPRFYTAEPIIPGAEDDPDLGPDPPERIWTDAQGWPLLIIDESADELRSTWRIELVPTPAAGAGAPAERPHATILGSGKPLAEIAPELAAALGEDREAPCPPATPQPHCIIVTLRPGARASELVARAAKDGITLAREGELWATTLSDADIVRHFGGRVVYQRMPASASNTGNAAQCNAYLEDVKIPARYARYIAGIAVGHQICE